VDVAAADAARAVGPHDDRPIGIFDSGVGGLSILRALRAELPHEDLIYFADSAHAPYGERDDAYVVARSLDIAQRLLDQHAKALVVACNTATAAAIHLLRAAHPGLPIIGVEPAVKPALAASRTRRIGVMATRGTLASAKFGALLASLQGQADFVLQPCDGLADAIERQVAGGGDAAVATLCQTHVAAMGRFGTAPGEIDTLVLGCTHYPFAAPHLAQLVGPAVTMIETGVPVARRTRQLLDAAGQLHAVEGGGRIDLQSSADVAGVTAAAARWLGWA
jgi:glutamate racemase